MTNKQRILAMVQRWPDDIALDKAICHLEVLEAIIESRNETGQDVEHEEFFQQILSDGQEDQNHVTSPLEKESPGDPPAHRSGRTKDGKQLHSAPKGSRKGSRATAGDR